MRKKSILACMLTALTVALGYALAAVPNIELMTVNVFISGFLLGRRTGSLVGIAAMTFYSLFNPMGASLPPLMLAQIVSFGSIGFAGGLLAPAIGGMGSRMASLLVAGAVGFIITLIYDLLTSIASYYVVAGINSGLWPFVAGGILFMAAHQVWNAAVFALALPTVLRVLKPFRNELIGIS